MSSLTLRFLGDPGLRAPTRQVERFGPALAELLEQMFLVMRQAEGVGLAAPQIGRVERVAVIELEERRLELVNPRLVRVSPVLEPGFEGCLSLPGFVAPLARPARVTVRAQDRRGRWRRIDGRGLLARALLHELDHLDGRLYLDRLADPNLLQAVALEVPALRAQRAATRAAERSPLRRSAPHQHRSSR
jgi:peptide deformylase